MKTLKALIAFIFTFTAIGAMAQTGADDIFVDQAWLQNHQSDDNLVLLHVANPKSYGEGHIAGAISIIPSEYMVNRDGLAWELPETNKIDAALRAKGVNNKSQVIIYYGGNDHAATFRLFFTLDYFGLSDRVRILDGGLMGWKSKNLDLTTSTTEVQETPIGDLKLKIKKKIKVDKDYVRKSAQKDKINLIDARRDIYYGGTQVGNYERGGHILGAGNICWLDVVDENMFIKDKSTLAAMYSAQGVGKKEQVVAYCHVGLRASTVYTLAKYLGFKARLYDGSFNEWDTLSEEYKVENGK